MKKHIILHKKSPRFLEDKLVGLKTASECNQTDICTFSLKNIDKSKKSS